MKKIIYLSLFILIICSCEKSSRIRLQTELDPIWRPDIMKSGKTLRGGFNAPITYNGNVLFRGTDNDRDVFYMVDGETGDVIWQWDDYLDGKADWRLYQVHQYGKYMVVQEGRRNYCLNLETGTTHWKKNLDDDIGSVVWGLDNDYFITSSWETDSLGHRISGIYHGRVEEGGKEELVVYPPYDMNYGSSSGTSGTIWNLYPIRNDNGEVLLNIFYMEFEDDKVISYLALYNFTKKEWIYDRQKIEEGQGGNYYAYGDKVYLGNHQLTICDIYTGEVLVRKDYGHDEDYRIGQMIYAEGKLLVTKDQDFYAFDAETGEIVWEDFGASTIGRLRYMDGVVYYASTGDGHIHAIDVEQGKHRWHAPSPDRDLHSGGGLTRMMTLLPGRNGKKGKVYASSYYSGYCFEAAK